MEPKCAEWAHASYHVRTEVEVLLKIQICQTKQIKSDSPQHIIEHWGAFSCGSELTKSLGRSSVILFFKDQHAVSIEETLCGSVIPKNYVNKSKMI